MRAEHVSKAVAAIRALSESGAQRFQPKQSNNRTIKQFQQSTQSIKQSNNQTIKQFKTIYFGGGTPALCNLAPFRGLFGGDAEFTVELHPLDATDAKLDELKSIGVNRISLGVQSFSDSTLASMGRLHSAADAERAFRKIRACGFDNSGLDLIAGWPGDAGTLDSVKRAIDLGAVHVSVYSLIVEPGTPLERSGAKVPSDGETLDTVAAAANLLAQAGIARYEVSNYAKPGFECRHNLATWRGEDYLGIGPGAHSRVGRERWRTEDGEGGWHRAGVETLSAFEDARERALFALRLAEGIDLARAERLFLPSAEEPEERERQAAEWKCALEAWRARFEALLPQGIVRRLSPAAYALTDRGLEVCDAVAAELV